MKIKSLKRKFGKWLKGWLFKLNDHSKGGMTLWKKGLMLIGGGVLVLLNSFTEFQPYAIGALVIGALFLVVPDIVKNRKYMKLVRKSDETHAEETWRLERR